MKYARKIQIGTEFRLCDVVAIPPPRQADPQAWLAKQFPTLSDWFELLEDVGNGAVEQPDGSFAQPIIPPRSRPRVYEWGDFNKFLMGLLNPNGRAKLQTILETARDFSGTDNAAKDTRSFYTWFVGSTTFTKDETAEMLQILVDASILTAPQRTAVLNNWAETTIL